MKTCLPERRNPRLAKAEGFDGMTRRDYGSGVAKNDTTIIFQSSIPVAHISGLFLAGVLRVPDRNSRDDARHGFNLDEQINPALTVPLVNWPVKPATAVPTHRTDSMLSNQREGLVPDRPRWLACKMAVIGRSAFTGKKGMYG